MSSSPAISRPVRIFFSYAMTASQDKYLFKKIKICLTPSRRKGVIDDAYDSESATRGNLEQCVEIFIEHADIIVLLVSPDYFDSERCAEEMAQAVKRHEVENTCLIPVLLRAAEWENTVLGRYTFLPSDGRPIKRKDMDNTLVEVSRKIREAAEEIAEELNAYLHSEPQSPLNSIPHEHSLVFTDREEILITLRTRFTEIQAVRQTRILALNGMLGSGKTQIAIEYVHRYKHEYQATLWLKATAWFEATPRHVLKEAIVSLAETLSFSEQDHVDDKHLFSAFKRWLQQHDGWLLIIDDLRDLHLMELFIPFQSSGHVLLTTYAQTVGPLVSPIPVPPMTTEDSALFLLRRARIIGEQAPPDEASETAYAQAALIVQEVDGLPLALDQAGAYIEETGCGLGRYLGYYRDQGTKTRLLEKRGKLTHVHPDSVKRTLSLTLEAIAREHAGALDLLHLCAFLHPDAIPREMIEQGASALGAPLRALAADAVALDEAIAILRGFSLVQYCTDPTMLGIHRVVQDILREEIMRGQPHRWASQAVRLMSRVFPDAEFSNWSTCEQYFAQARSCAELITEFHITQKEAARLLQHLGSYCYQRAYYQDAERYLTAALQIYRQSTRPDQGAHAQALNNLGLVYHKQGKYHEAEEHYQQAREMRERIHDADHTDIAQTLNNLALLYKDVGRYQEAEELYQRVRIIDEHTLGPDHPDTAVTLFNLALVYDEQGKYALAEPLYQRAFSIEERTLSADHPDLALSLNMQASQYEDQGNYPEAEILYQRALVILERSVGPEHPDTAQSLHGLARLYEAQERYQDAQALYQQALAVLEHSVGPDHLDTARTLNDLAGLYDTQERYQEAEMLYQQALKVYEQILGSEHLDTANILNNLAWLLRRQKRYQEAEELYRRALEIYEQSADPEHPGIATLLNNLGGLYRLMEKDELAEQFLRRGVEICERVFGKEHLETGRILRSLADLLIYQHRYEQAKPLYQRILDINQHILGSEHPDVASILDQYALLLEHIKEQGKP